MQIAIIGWGSLIWCPGCLRIKSRWRLGGPSLPIEFARISQDKRLTLVVHPDAPEQPTYWALSDFKVLKQARENLKARESAKLKDIHSLISGGEETGQINPRISSRIREWLGVQQNLEAAIWTGLACNWEDEGRGRFTHRDAVRYLGELEDARNEAMASYERAREYVTNSPQQIQTPVRKTMQQKKGWEDAALPAVLFETTTGNLE